MVRHVGTGGRIPGAGRKPGCKTLVKRAEAADILGSIDEMALWQKLLKSKSEKIVLDAIKYLTDRRDGKAVEAVKLSGDNASPIEILVRHIGTDD